MNAKEPMKNRYFVTTEFKTDDDDYFKLSESVDAYTAQDASFQTELKWKHQDHCGGRVFIKHWVVSVVPHPLTPDREKIFDAAMQTLHDPIKLLTLADAFEAEGLLPQAAELRKRTGR